MSPHEQEMRARILEMASRADPHGAVDLARGYLAFVTGESDQSPREKIDAALEVAGVS